MVENVAKWFLLCVLCSQCCVVSISSATDQCGAQEGATPLSSVVISERGELAALANSARATRRSLLSRPLPYALISSEIRELQNGSSLNVNLLLEGWVQYSQNALFLAGFVIFVGVVLPLVIVALWICWECCYEEDEEEDEENKNLTLTAQVLSWLVSVLLVAVLLVLFVFLCLLLAANSWLSSGVARGLLLNSTLPQAAQLRDSAFDQVTRILLNDFDSLNSSLYSSILNDIPAAVIDRVSQAHSKQVESLHNETLNSARTLHLHALSLQELCDSYNRTLTSLTTALHQALTNILEYCSGVILPSNACTTLLASQRDSLLPTLAVDLCSTGGGGGEVNNHSLISELVELLAKDPGVNDSFQDYLASVGSELECRVGNLSDAYLRSFRANLSAVRNGVVEFYNSSLTFGLPQSQEQLSEYLGERYLQNWEVFRSITTVTFVLIIMIMEVCVAVAMVRGLVNIFAIFREGVDPPNVEAAHQAGTMMKKLAFGFSLVCFVSAIFFSFFLCIAGIIGEACEPNNNFTAAVNDVIDNPETWNNQYPLGRALIGDAHHQLLARDVLERCRSNHSLFVALALEGRYNLETTVDIDDAVMLQYLEGMMEVSTWLPPPSLLPPSSPLPQAALLPLHWAPLTTLTSTQTLFQDGFAGLAALQDSLPSPGAGSSALQGNLTALVDAAQQSLANLTQLTATLNATLPGVRTSASALQAFQEGAGPPQPLELQTSISVNTTKISNEELSVAAARVNVKLETFLATTRRALECDVGSCLSLARDYDELSSAVCGDVVPGMDVYWTSLISTLTFSIILMMLALFLASRFINLKLQKASNRNFDMTSAVIRQCRAVFWLAFSIGINLWFIVTVSLDEYFNETKCQGSSSGPCCPTCIWGSGVFFVLLAAVVGGVFRLYQCLILFRIKKCKASKVRRFWVDRKKAFQFYGQLCQLIVQDIPFLVLSGVYTNDLGTLNVSTFFSLTVSLVGIISYFFYLFLERHNIPSYLSWLRDEAVKLKSSSKIRGTPQEGQPPVVGGVSVVGGAQAGSGPRSGGRSPHGSTGGSEHSDGGNSQATTQRDGDWHFNPPPTNHYIDHSVLPVIQEDENLTDRMRRANGFAQRPVMGHDEEEFETDLSQSHPMSTVHLDNCVDPEHEALQERREAALHRGLGGGGVEVAQGHFDFDTSSMSYSGSINSLAASELPGYYSSSLAPDEHYESSDYRDDYDSDYSQARYRYQPRLNGTIGEVSIEV